MKHLYPIIVFLCSITAASAQFSDHELQCNAEISACKKHKVKSCTISEERYENGLLKSKDISEYFEYNEEGRLVLEKFYFDVEKGEYDLIRYTYDAKGRLLSEEWEEHPQNEGSLNGKEEYSYRDGKLVSICLHENGIARNECTYYHYKDGKLVEITDSLLSTHVYEYTNDKIICRDKNNESLYRVYNSGYQLIEWKFKSQHYYYEYNADGQIRSSYSMADGKKIRENNFTYKDGLCISAEIKDLVRGMVTKETYTYEYFR